MGFLKHNGPEISVSSIRLHRYYIGFGYNCQRPGMISKLLRFQFQNPIEFPPSTGIMIPVMYFAPSSARNSAASAMSDG